MLHGEDTKIWGVTTVGTKGQLVIPSKLREKLNLNPGDELLVVSRERGNAIILLPEKATTAMLKGTLDKIEGLKQNSRQGSRQEGGRVGKK